MSVTYEIAVDEDQIREAINLFEFVGGNTTDAIRYAINAAAPKIKTASSRAIRTQVRLTAKYVRERLTLIKATRSNLNGAIRTPSRGLLLTRYSSDATIASDAVSWIKPPPVPADGIKVKVKPTGSAQVVGKPPGIISKPFYMVLKGGNLGIVGRTAYAGKQGSTIEVFYGPSLSQVFNTVRDDVLPVAAEEYQAQLLDAMRYVLVKKYPPPDPPEDTSDL